MEILLQLWFHCLIKNCRYAFVRILPYFYCTTFLLDHWWHMFLCLFRKGKHATQSIGKRFLQCTGVYCKWSIFLWIITAATSFERLCTGFSTARNLLLTSSGSTSKAESLLCISEEMVWKSVQAKQGNFTTLWSCFNNSKSETLFGFPCMAKHIFNAFHYLSKELSSRSFWLRFCATFFNTNVNPLLCLPLVSLC